MAKHKKGAGRHRLEKQTNKDFWRIASLLLMVALVMSMGSSKGNAVGGSSPSAEPSVSASPVASPTPTPTKTTSSVAKTVMPGLAKRAKHHRVVKSTRPQHFKLGKWTYFENNDGYPIGFAIGRKRTLFMAQVHIYCRVQPRYIKIRLARVMPDGNIDTTGTNTWTLGPTSTNKWQGSLWWEINSDYPVSAQFKVKGGKGCYSPQRQFKWWRP